MESVRNHKDLLSARVRQRFFRSEAFEIIARLIGEFTQKEPESDCGSRVYRQPD